MYWIDSGMYLFQHGTQLEPHALPPTMGDLRYFGALAGPVSTERTPHVHHDKLVHETQERKVVSTRQLGYADVWQRLQKRLTPAWKIVLDLL
jgi:hypothetical protein